MSNICSENNSDYSPSSIVNFFHDIPHFDIDLEQSPSDFDASLSYLEAVIIWGSIPILACVCLFILMSVYYICVCCCFKEKKVRPRAYSWGCALLVSLLIIFCLGLIGAGLYSEFSLNSDVVSFIDEGAKINNEFKNFTSEINKYNYTEVAEALEVVLDGISDSNIREDVTALMSANDNINDGFSSIRDPLESVQFTSYINDADYYEELRHWVIVGYLIFFAVILLVTFIVSLCLTSAGTIIMLIIVGVVTVTMWILCGGSLSLVMVMSDVCANPDGVVRTLLNDTDTAGVVDYYIVCVDECYPFTEETDKINEALSNAEVLEEEIASYIESNVTDPNVNRSFAIVSNGIAVAQTIIIGSNSWRCVKSDGIHDYYRKSLDIGCEEAFPFVIMFFSLASGLAVCLLVLMCCMSCFAGLLASTLSEDIDEEFVAYDTPRGSTWSQRRSSYTEPYSNNGFVNEEYRLTGLSRNATIEPPKYTDVGRPLSGEYDHFDT